jgi:methylmalonyl-CoA/ethylmalonyl-CoA epimerase
MRRVGTVLARVITLVGAVVAIHPLRAQAPAQTPMATTAVPHVGIIVKDIDEAIRRFQDIFGITISKPQDVGPLVFRGTPPPDAASSRLKVAAFKVGNMGFEIVQPIAGPSPHRQFLDRYGQGLQHVAFEVQNTQAGVNYLVSKGGTWTTATNVDMQGILGFSTEVRQAGAPTAVPQTTPVVAQTPMSNAVITHIGLIVPDIDKTSRAFSEIFGVEAPKAEEFGPLTFPVNSPPNAASSRVRFNHFTIGNMTIELIQPTAGPGPHRDHLDKFGLSLHHLAFNIKDQKTGIDYLVSKGGRWTIAPYVDMRDILGFTAELRTAP